MPCYHPKKGYRSHNPCKPIIFYKPYAGAGSFPVPCGQCIGCRLERSRQWAIRMYHEASLYKNNCFITLTYDEKHLPTDHSLHKEDYQKFMKRLREKYSHTIRFFHCGEYGDLTFRPHYHAILFNHEFDNQKLAPCKQPFDKKHKLYNSKALTDLWPFGMHTIAEANFETMAYCARYIMKKQTGEHAKCINPLTGLRYYERLDQDTGEIYPLLPEYTTMSLRPGIGAPWLEKWHTDVYPSDSIIINGKQMKPPKFYDSKFEHEYPDGPDLMKEIKKLRREKAEAHASDNTPERLAVKEKVKKAQIKSLMRTL